MARSGQRGREKHLLNSIAGVKEVKNGDILYMNQSILKLDAEAGQKGVILVREGRQIPKFSVWKT